MKYFQQRVLILFLMISSVYCKLPGLTAFISISKRSYTQNSRSKFFQDDPACRFRNWPFVYESDEIWRFLTGSYCYSYTPPQRLNFRHNLTLVYRNSLPFQITRIDGLDVYFDYLNDTYVQLLSDSFVNERFLNLWKECSELAALCCENELTLENITPNEEYVCPALWDGWDCWPRTRALEAAFNDCPSHIYTEEEIPCTLQSEKYCLSDGWEVTTNYVPCSLTNCIDDS